MTLADLIFYIVVVFVVSIIAIASGTEASPDSSVLKILLFTWMGIGFLIGFTFLLIKFAEWADTVKL